MPLDVIQSLFDKAEFDKALNIIETSTANKLDLMYLKSIAYRKIWMIDESIESANQLLVESRTSNNRIHELNALIQLGYSTILNGSTSSITNSLNYLTQFEKIWNDLNAQEKSKLEEIEAYYYHVKGTSSGNYAESIDYYIKSLKIRKNLRYKFELIPSLHQLAYFSILEGEYETSFQYATQLLDVADTQGNDDSKSFAYESLAEYYRIRGEFSKVEIYYQKIVEINERLISRYNRPTSYINKYGTLARMHELQGNWDKCIEASENVIQYLEIAGRDYYISNNIYNLITFALKVSDKALIDKYMKKLDALVIQSNNHPKPIFYQQLCKALIFKSNKRAKQKTEAQKIFEELLEKKLFHEYRRVEILFHLAELLLDELKLYGEEEVLSEITNVIKKISEIAEDQNLHSLRIEALLLQSRLAFFNREVIVSNKLIQEARSIADNTKLTHFQKIIKDEEIYINTEIELASEITNKAAPFRDRLEKIKIIDYINEMKKLTKGIE
ncbi:MAG: hypothetical protein HeimC2_26320 [Candidatus Heimdallarchaeota archaeon LC_2]|nr:MAG: hypothetical protein HeimC2_26320 [Candidatus Heimdallarchaeota archaeon LC_2]